MQTIESQDLSLGKLFEDFYIVPSYQREYVWGKKQVLQLLQDIFGEFDASSSTDPAEYFIGTVVVSAQKNNTFEIIDGQQRITTAFLILCAFRDKIQEIAPNSSNKTLERLIQTSDIDETGKDIFRYRVSLQYEKSTHILQRIAERNTETLDYANLSETGRRIVDAYYFSYKFLDSQFENDLDYLGRFFAYFARKVNLIRITTLTVMRALTVFETINERGVSLTSMDLLKNLLFMQVDESKFDQLRDKWKQLTDILEGKEKALRFLRYFIFANYDVPSLSEKEVYSWIVGSNTVSRYKEDPIAFSDKLIASAQAYVNFLSSRDPGGAINPWLQNISIMSGYVKQHLIVFLAAKDIPTDCFNELAKHIENTLFVYITAGGNPKSFEKAVINWTRDIRRIRNLEDVNKLHKACITPFMAGLIPKFEAKFLAIDEDNTTPSAIRYILAKATHFVNCEGFGEQDPDLTPYLQKPVEIEHILPQSPTNAIIRSFDKPEEISSYTHMLGNLVLLEMPLNRSLKNKAFQDKVGLYRESRFLLTRSLAETIMPGSKTSINRALAGLEPFSSWTSADIECRQSQLLDLAKRVWSIPYDEDTSKLSRRNRKPTGMSETTGKPVHKEVPSIQQMSLWGE